jgi:hypothetical protein
MGPKIFEKVLKETLNSKFSRILSKSGYKMDASKPMDLCGITAFLNLKKKPEYSNLNDAQRLAKNRQRNKELESIMKDLAKEKHYGYYHKDVIGGYENPGSGEDATYEESYVITHNPNDTASTTEEFVEDMIALGGTANQDGILIKRADEEDAQLYTVKDSNSKKREYDISYTPGKAGMRKKDANFTSLGKMNDPNRKEMAFRDIYDEANAA